MFEKKIQSESFKPIGSASEEKSVLPKTTAKAHVEENANPVLIYAVIGVLAIIALSLVIAPGFFKSTMLPDTSSEKNAVDPATLISSQSSQENEENSVLGSQSAQSAAGETPFDSALAQQARSDAQAILADLLANIQTLEDLQVSKWGESEIQKIKALAVRGDEDYAEVRFENALSLYKEALEGTKTLLASTADTAQQYFLSGEKALEQNNVEKAIADLELANLLTPSDQIISELLSRARVRTEVFALELSAENNLRQEKLELARANYQSIQKLDAEYKDVGEKISNINKQILERDFARAMSDGFQNLAAGELRVAESAFKRADALKPKNESVRNAMLQIEAAKITNIKQDAIDQAVAFENAEQWQNALDIYQELLAEDDSLVTAKLGQIRTQARAQLASRINEVLEDPLKLQDQRQWQAANQILTDAWEVIDKGPVLAQQIDKLEEIVKRARTKVTLAMLSDSNTDIEIYRMSKLGKFKEHAVALYPGRYVVVGSRSGFRDVRHDLVLDGTESEVQINIACTERI